MKDTNGTPQWFHIEIKKKKSFTSDGLRDPIYFSIQFTPLNRLGRRGDMRDDSAEIFYQSLLWEAIVNSSSTDIATSTLWRYQSSNSSADHSNVPRKMVLERLAWRVTCPNHPIYITPSNVKAGLAAVPTSSIIFLRRLVEPIIEEATVCERPAWTLVGASRIHYRWLSFTVAGLGSGIR